MANTVMTAKNSFEEGLIMDLSPDNTSANSLTSALNATLITFNGNEMQLQNDMGNGRVETARLPDGYIPMGTCEFGDIIYIVSYNPIIDKAQIGCFPSPERNISSTEISSITQALTASDFQNFDASGPTGELRTTSVKKVLIETKKLNPGDKYIIYTNTAEELINNKECLSDFGANDHGETHKYVKLHVVSIDDSGKITYLDTTTKWYDVNGFNYYINKNKIKTSTQSTDLDEYRNLTESNWSIFSSKHSGKIAILAELETIDTFSCSYTLDFLETTELNDVKYKKYKLYLSPEYQTQGRKLPYLCITKAKFNNTDLIDNKGNKVELNESQVYYHNTRYGSNEYPGEQQYPIYNATTIVKNENIVYNVEDYDDNGVTKFKDVEIGTITIPYQQKVKDTWVDIQSSSFIYNLEITPAMEYGRLDYLTVDLSIDFNKIGTGEVSITDWKYHNSGTTSILSYGIDAYPKPGYKIDSIIIHFYDNQGFVGEYKLSDKNSYSGVFTEYLGLDGENINSRFSRYNSIKGRIEKHLGNEVESITSDYDPDDYYDTTHLNDAGTLYSNFLYGAKIIINWSKKDGSNPDSKSYYRWFWTTTMFNEYYYQIRDFDILDFELILNGEVLYESIPQNFVWKNQEINNLGNSFSEESLNHYNTYSANIQYIGKEPNQSKQNNVNMYVKAGLQEDYGCFNLFKDRLSDINLEVYLSTGKILYSLDGDYQYQFSDKEMNVTDPAFLSVQNIIKTDGDGTEGFKYLEGTALNSVKIDTENTIKDDFNITFSDFYSTTEKTIDQIKQEGKGMITLIDDENNNTKCQVWVGTLNDCYFSSQNDKKEIPLILAATLLNKAYTQNIYESTVKVPVYLPMIENLDDLKALGITYTIDTSTYQQDIKLGFNTGMYMCQHGGNFGAGDFTLDKSTLYFTSAVSDESVGQVSNSGMINPSEHQEFINNAWAKFGSSMGEFFPVYLGGHDDTGCYCAQLNDSPKNPANITQWMAGNNIPLYRISWDSNVGNKSRLTSGSFDTRDGVFGNVNEYNVVMFLGMKYKNGFTLFNTATSDSFTTTPSYQFKQWIANYGNGKYANFAYQLYLIFSNLYHKNKRSEDKQINIKNFVRNGDYDVQLQKNIIIKLDPKPAEQAKDGKHDILIKGVSFNEYSGEIMNRLYEDNNNYTINTKNITLKFLNYAHNSQLQVNVNSEPMSFLNTDAEAYLLKNGALIGTQELGNQFYIWQNNQLEVIQNKILQFDAKEVISNLRYILGESIDTTKATSLKGAYLKQTTEYDDYESAYNFYLYEIRNYIFNQVQSSIANYQYMDQTEAQNALFSTWLPQLSGYLPDYYTKLDETTGETIQVYSKEYILDRMQQQDKLIYSLDLNTSAPEFGMPFYYLVYVTDYYNGSYWRIQVNGNAGDTKSHIITAKNYEIDHYLDMNKNFKYNNKLELDTSISHDTFGISHNSNSYNVNYCGFLEDVVLDKKHQVLR